MSYDLIAIDIDGTLISEDRKLTEPVIEAIHRVVQAGKKIVLCTGRPLPGAQPYMEQLGLNKKGDYMITYHGALVQRTDTLETVIDHKLDNHDLLKWYDFSKSIDVNFQTVQNDTIFTNQTKLNFYALIESFINEIPLQIRPIEEIESQLSFSKFIMADEMEIIQKAEDHVPLELRKNYTILRSMPNALEVLNRKASKGQSLKELANLLDIPTERVMAIGDSGNDIDMIEYAGLGVAMGNAIPQAKKIADVITDTAADDGVANAINKFVFND